VAAPELPGQLPLPIPEEHPMGLTAVPGDEPGTLEISRGGEPVIMTAADVEASDSFGPSEKLFLAGLFAGLAAATRPSSNSPG
jgi:hypothetical protein